MITLYTAVGHCKDTSRIDYQTHSTVFLGNKELYLNAHEMILWFSLMGNILTFDEIKARFYELEADLSILSDLEFEYYLKRLIFRGLVASGTNYTGINALNDLLSPLYIHAAPSGLLSKLFTLADLMFRKKYSFKMATKVIYREKLSKQEKHLLRLNYKRSLPTYKLLLMENSVSTLTVLATLYLKRYIVFDVL